MGVLSRQLFVLVLMRGGVMPQISGPFRVAFCLLEFISRRSDLKPLANLITWCNLIWTASEAGARRLQVLPILERVRRFFPPPPLCGGCVSGFLWPLLPIHIWRTVRTAWPACWRPKHRNERISFTHPIVESFVKGWNAQVLSSNAGICRVPSGIPQESWWEGVRSLQFGFSFPRLDEIPLWTLKKKTW